MKAPEQIETARLVLERPTAKDVESIFGRYSSDPEVTRYLAWPRHTTPADTEFFLKFSDSEWNRWPAGPYLVRFRENGTLLGSTGLAFESAEVASTGYVFAKDAWGKGFATETVRAMVDLARTLGVRRLNAICHREHQPSAHVLEKTGFTREAVLPAHTKFPNLGAPVPSDVFSYAIILTS